MKNISFAHVAWAEIRTKLAETPDGQFKRLTKLLEPYPDDEVKALLFDLGGHDLKKIISALDLA